MGRKESGRRPRKGVRLELQQLGKSKLVLLPVEPYLVHLYWEVAGSDLKRAKRILAREYRRSKAILRFHDSTGAALKDVRSRDSFDVEIQLDAGNWYVPLWRSNRTYFVELGLRTRSGRFFLLARSNIADTPRDSTASDASERYAEVTDAFEVVEIKPERVSQYRPSESHMILQHQAEAVESRVRTEDPVTEKGLPSAVEPACTRDESGEDAASHGPATLSAGQDADTEAAMAERNRCVGRQASMKPPAATPVHAGNLDVLPAPDSKAVLNGRLKEFSELRTGFPAPSKETLHSVPETEIWRLGPTHRKWIDLTGLSEDLFAGGGSPGSLPRA